MLRFLFDAKAVALCVELCHAVALRIVDVIAEDSGLSSLLHVLHALFQQLCEACTVEDVVAEYEAGAVVSDKFLADDECLCQSAGIRLLGILKPYAYVAAVAKQTLKHR